MVIDTSAIIAMLLGEPLRGEVELAMRAAPCRMSAATRVELGIVVESRRGAEGTLLVDELLRRFSVEIRPLDERQAEVAVAGWRRFGKGRHRAALNYGDCFAYALAIELAEPLLFIGEDFTHTDVQVALDER